MTRVGLDYLPAVQHAPGVGRYVRELVRALVRRADAPELALFEGGLGPRPMEGEPLGLAEARVPVRRRRLPLPRRLLEPLARAGLGADRLCGGVDLFHRVHAGHPPLSRAPHTLAVAELPAPGARDERCFLDAVRAAAGVVTFSRHAQDEVARRAELGPERVHFAPVGSEHWERALGGRRIPRRDPPEVLALGAVRDARSPLLLLEAFEALRAGGTPARLVLCGRPGDAAAAFSSALEASRFRADVRWIAAPVEAELPELVAGASVLAHLATAEATPVTVLEACRLGPTVVASDLPALHEALGDEADWVPSGTDAGGLAALLECGLEAAADGAARVRRGDLARAFTWDACALAHIRSWNRILARPTLSTDDRLRP